jgi:hypothetical protein
MPSREEYKLCHRRARAYKAWGIKMVRCTSCQRTPRHASFSPTLKPRHGRPRRTADAFRREGCRRGGCGRETLSTPARAMRAGHPSRAVNELRMWATGWESLTARSHVGEPRYLLLLGRAVWNDVAQTGPGTIGVSARAITWKNCLHPEFSAGR